MKKILLILMTCAVAMGLYAQQPCPGVPTVTDVEGNVYNTVKIGNQCWMKENLRTTHFVDGNPIFSGDLYSAISDTISYYYESPDSVIPLVERGLLYNWLAANNVCPTGWHLPTNAEWNTMEATQTTYSLTGTGWRGDHAGRLAGGTDWRYTTSTPDSTPGFSNYTAYNASGFTAIPAGYRYNSYMESKWAAYFWTATSGGGTLAWHRKLYYNKIGVYHSTQNTAFGLSVRCLRDPGPVINTGSLLGITTTSVTCGGEVLDDDGYSVTARGVCWSTSHNPTIANAHTSNGTGVGSFTSSLTGLTPGTTYYVRAYATNSQGTKYGEEVVFATQNPPCPGVPTVTDHEGNVYNTIKIGNQCWTKENLRTTTSPSTGTYLIPAADVYSTYTGKQARWYNNDSATYAPMNYGLLYNWNAAVDTFNTAYGETSVNTNSSNALSVTFNGHRRGICPVGWHLPSDNEWQQLTNYMGSVPGYQCGGNSSSIAKALASTTEWSSNSDACNVGNQQGSNNATGFSAIPAGAGLAASFILLGQVAYFGSSSQYTTPYKAYCYILSSEQSSVESNLGALTDNGLSVRCLRDPIPAVSTGSVLGVTSTTATCGGEVVNAGGSSVTARGVCWSTSHNPTVADAHTSNGTGVGTFTSSLTGLTSGTTYYVRAYATNSEGTAYGEEVSFFTPNSPCPGVPTVTDRDGNVYNTIKIGNQCWTKENLRTKHYADGTAIPAGESVTSNSEPYYYDNINDSLPLEKKGYFYNWPAVMHGSASSNANPSGVQGICPTGWHVPSDAEWTQLTDYVSSQSLYRCRGYNTNIAKALASETWWSNSDEGNYCAVGHNQTTNNLTGFSAVPVGYRDDSSFGYDEGIAAFFWSSTQDGSNNAWARNLFCINATVYRESDNKYDALSVRCLRDLAPAITTGSVLGVTTTTATCGGEVVDDGGFTVTARGVCWSTSHNSTIADAHTNNGTGLGQFTSSITGLTPGTTYYVRAYATYSAGTTYGEEVSFFTECRPEDQCELTFVLTDSYGDGWNGNAILVKDAQTGVLLGYMTNEDMDGLFEPGETTTMPLALCNGRTVNFEWESGSYAYETSYTVYDGQGEVIFSGSGGFTEPISYIVTCASPCPAISLPYTENFDSFTSSTTTETGVEPDCWEVFPIAGVTLTNATKPQLYRGYATSGAYTLRLKNRCVYAMPELDENVSVSGLTMTFRLRQPNKIYRLQVGVLDAQGNFTSVKTLNNTSTGTEDVTVDFANYTGNGHRIAFRNTLTSGSTLEYSINYLDNIVLDYTPAPCGISELPYRENFDDYTQTTTTETGVEPDCWEVFPIAGVTLTNATKPQLYRGYATSGAYTLRLKNRCVYAMPELDENVRVSGLTMTFRLRQPKAVYRLQVGVLDAQGNFTSVKTLNNTSTGTEDVTVDFSNYTGNGHQIAFRNTLTSGSTLEYSINYLDNIVLDYTPAPCGISELPYSENFDDYTQTTTTETGVEPDCWEVLPIEGVTLTNATKPQLYRGYATSGAYTLRLKNRCVYAMPELDGNVSVSGLTMTFRLRQPKAVYRLQVGVLDAQGNFTSVKTLNNASTGTEDVTVDFANYTGNGHRIAFRNTLTSGSTLEYSINYLDNIVLDYTPVPCGISELPYTENFDDYTQSTTTETGVEPDCWEVLPIEGVTLTNATKPQLYRGYATSGAYTLRLKNRCVYAMPELDGNVNVSGLTMTLNLRQPSTNNRLQVGVLEANGSFTVVKTLKSGTSMQAKTVDFSGYTGTGKRIAFRNTLVPGTGMSTDYLDYSINYIDDIVLVRTANNKGAEVTDGTAVDALAADLDQVDVVVYPNPTKDVVNVQCTMDNVQCSGIEIVDVYGKIITTVDQTATQINVSGLAAGMYFVRVTTDRGVVTKPFVKR